MSAETKLKERMEELVTQGESLMLTKKTGDWGAWVDQDVAVQWTTSVHQVIRLALGDDSIHMKRLMDLSDLSRRDSYYSKATSVLSILRAALDDFSGGFTSLPRLVEAEVFDSLLEQAEELLNKGYKDAAAVLVGGVLEEHLRSMCGSRGISLVKDNGKRKTIDNTLNADLARTGAYNKLKQKQITAWADLRNKAAHGNYSEYDSSDVATLLNEVSKFCADFA